MTGAGTMQAGGLYRNTLQYIVTGKGMRLLVHCLDIVHEHCSQKKIEKIIIIIKNFKK